MIYRFYRYYFYRVYKEQVKKDKHIFLPESNALYSVGTLIAFNVIDILGLLQLLGYLTLETIIFQYTPLVILCFAVLGIMIHFLFYRNKKYLKILEEFKDEPPKQKNRNLILIRVYFWASLLWIVVAGLMTGYFRDKATWYENEPPVKQEIAIPINIDTTKIDDYERFSGYDTLEQDELNEIMKQQKKK